MNHFKSRLLTSSLAVTIMMVGFAAIGCMHAYTPIPMWDMWDGTVGFLDQIRNGNYSAWWSQFNEHRIVLSRVLFWIDAQCFGGRLIFLFATNYLLVGCITLLFWGFLKLSNPERKLTQQDFVIGVVMTGWLFLWTQADNFTWAFQSQFLLAQCLPLGAFFWLLRSALPLANITAFLVACCFGVLSVGTMANGVLALPLMVVFALFARQSLHRVTALVALSGLTLAGYFHDYHAVQGHGSLTHEFINNPLDIVRFVLLYLGSPFYYLAGKWITGKIIATAMGVMLTALSVRVTIAQIRAREKNLLTLALLSFIAYVAATALGTAGGRLMFGLDTAFNLRYGTPVLMAWAALAIIYRDWLLALFDSKRIGVRIGFGIFLLAMLATQANALRSSADVALERKVAVLALELGVPDEQQIHFIYPFADQLEAKVDQYRAEQLSVFGQYPYQGVRARLGTQPDASTALKGKVTEIGNVDGTAGFNRVSGWIEVSGRAAPDAIWVVAADQRIVGYAMVDVAAKGGRYLFKGYLVGKLDGNLGLRLRLID